MAKDPGAHLRAVKHGAYSKNLVVSGEGLDTRPEIVEALRYRANRALQMCEIITGHVAAKVQAGVDLDTIPSLNRLPAFQNSATRMLTALYAMMPSDANVVDAGDILDAYRSTDE